VTENKRTETRKQQGHITQMVNGQLVRVPVMLTIEDTYYEGSDRKDCTIKVPRLGTSAKGKQ
jgi:hypothetical protein